MKSPLNLVKSLLAVASVAAVSAVSAAPASAFNFSNIPGGATAGDAYNGNFGFTLESQGGSVLFNIFNFGNAAAPNMFVGGIYFQDTNNSLSNPWANVNNVGTVGYSGGASGAQLPQGGNNFNTNYAFFSNNGNGNAQALQGGEKFGVLFDGTYANVLAGLTSGAIRVGLHVQALPNGQSDSYVSSNTEDTPEPLTMLAAGAAVGFGTMFKKQRDQAQKAE